MPKFLNTWDLWLRASTSWPISVGVGMCIILMPYTWYMGVITCALMPKGKVVRMVLMSSTALGQSTSSKKPLKERSKIFLDGPWVVVLAFFAGGGAWEVAADIAGVEG
jgi:hypothetical protein